MWIKITANLTREGEKPIYHLQYRVFPVQCVYEDGDVDIPYGSTGGYIIHPGEFEEITEEQYHKEIKELEFDLI